MASAPKNIKFIKKINNLDFSHVNALKMVRSSYLVDSSFEPQIWKILKFDTLHLKRLI